MIGKKSFIEFGAQLILLAFIVLCAVGWVWNIVKLAEMCCEVSGWLVLRAAGIFVAPLGIILGFL